MDLHAKWHAYMKNLFFIIFVSWCISTHTFIKFREMIMEVPTDVLLSFSVVQIHTQRWADYPQPSQISKHTSITQFFISSVVLRNVLLLVIPNKTAIIKTDLLYLYEGQWYEDLLYLYEGQCYEERVEQHIVRTNFPSCGTSYNDMQTKLSLSQYHWFPILLLTTWITHP